MDETARLSLTRFEHFSSALLDEVEARSADDAVHSALWPTVGQFFVGPVALLTLPTTQGTPATLMGIFGVTILVSIWMTMLMFVETRRPAARVGGSFVSICALMVVVLGLMGAGRHVYREAAVAPHRELVRAKTEDYMRRVDEANRAAGATRPVRP